jgi:hypothetical protein
VKGHCLAKKSIEMIVEKALKRYKSEVTLLWLLMAMGTVLIITGTGTIEGA